MLSREYPVIAVIFTNGCVSTNLLGIQIVLGGPGIEFKINESLFKHKPEEMSRRHGM